MHRILNSGSVHDLESPVCYVPSCFMNFFVVASTIPKSSSKVFIIVGRNGSVI